MTALLSNQTTRTLMAAVAAGVIAANVIVQIAIERTLVVGEAWWLIQDRVGLERLNNTGIAFGIGDGSGSLVIAMVIVALAVLLWMVASGVVGQSSFSAVAGGLILGGAIGNLVDRLPDGTVTDYVAVGGWPRFNVADAALTIGVVFLIGLEIRSGRQDVK